ncbi:MAG: M1 family aminopeptidase [Betaproteobacteria bacterium]
MTMFAIAWFDFTRRLRMVATYVYFGLFGAMAALWMAAAGGAFASASVSFGGDKILINGTYALGLGITVLGFMGIMVVGSVAGRAVQQDYEYGTYHFFFSAPIAKHDYFFGRLIGAWMTLALIFSSIALGIVVGTHWPGVSPTRIVAAPPIESFLRPYLFLLLPNMVWMGGCFFVLAALTRQMAPVFVAGVIALVGYLFAIELLGDMDNKLLAAMVDPSGATALDLLARYWSVAQKNTELIPLDGALLWNRALWVGFGLIVIMAGYRAFQMQAVTAGSKRKRRAVDDATAPASLTAAPIAIPSSPLDRSTGAFLRMLPGLTRLYVVEILRSPRFLIIVLGGVLLVVGNSMSGSSSYGTSTYPLTYRMLDVVSGLFSLFILIVTAIYAGELVWRERDVRMDDITDSTPAPTWLGFLSKFLALLCLQLALLIVVLVCSIGVQLAQGFTRIDMGHYLFELFVLQFSAYALIAVLALTVHTLVNNKYLGHFAVVLLFIVTSRLPDFGFEDRLYRYAARPDIVYSDLNGYGHFLTAVTWFRVYWGAFAVMLMVLAYSLWVRGRDGGWHGRWRIAATRMTPTAWGVTAAGVLTLVGSGGFIFYNTHVLNTYYSRDASKVMQANYERRYKSLALAPQPKVTAVNVRADIFPDEQRARLSGTLALVNKSAQPISDLYVHYPRQARATKAEPAVPHTLAESDTTMRWHHIVLTTPMAPGSTMNFNFDIEYGARGFRNDGADPTVLGNGTFLNPGVTPDTSLIPSFGYDESAEIASDSERKKYGLPDKPRMHDLDDKYYQQQSALTRDADFIDYRAEVCTSADQLPLTSGYVESDRTEGGRRCIKYKMDSPMSAVYPFVSARYAIKRDVWQGPDGDVAIEIDYHPGHEYNIDRMIAGVKDSLAYFTKNFGPYQHKIVRIVEFPRFSRGGGFAESFPNTVPFNEAIGFTAKVDDTDPKDLDYPYFVTAHEVAHQWWAHQEVPANVQGGEFVTESLSEYSALMVMKHKYGDAKMRRFLKYELDRYLLGRGMEQKGEPTLLRADGAAYVHYQKGALVLYALQDVIGEAALNDALSAFVKRWRFKGPPYPTSRDLLVELKRVTPAEHQELLADFIENITLFDDRAVRATPKKLPDGKYEVTLVVSAKKIHADGAGNEREAPLDAPMDIGVQDAKGDWLFLEKRRVKSGENTFVVTVDGEPKRAGIDPLNKLIDRDTSDNIVDIGP